MRLESDSQGYRRVFLAGTRIFREGEHGRHAFIIERGTVNITYDRDGEDVKLAELGPGDIFGEMSLIDNDVRSATAIAVEETEVIMIRREQIQKSLSQADETMKMLLDVLLGRFRAMQERLAKGQNPKEVDERPSAGVSSAHARALQRLKFEQELKTAISEESFKLVFQPIVSLSEGVVEGFEALIRWEHEERGLISPKEFIGMAESAELILAIDQWVCRTAFDLLSAMYHEGGGTGRKLPFISLNFSGLSLADGTMLREMKERLTATGLDPNLFRVELTEGILIDNPETFSVILDEMRKLGVRIMIDDFGTGYSSLSNLVRFPIHSIKIDRAFVNAMNEPTGREVVEATIRMAHSLGMQVVAEGIETLPELQSLWRMQCDYGQGYLFCKPVDIQEALDFADRGELITRGPVLIHPGAGG